jgi:hypothetical protein
MGLTQLTALLERSSENVFQPGVATPRIELPSNAMESALQAKHEGRKRLTALDGGRSPLTRACRKRHMDRETCAKLQPTGVVSVCKSAAMQPVGSRRRASVHEGAWLPLNDGPSR